MHVYVYLFNSCEKLRMFKYLYFLVWSESKEDSNGSDINAHSSVRVYINVYVYNVFA